jgi:hypothetical protein
MLAAGTKSANDGGDPERAGCAFVPRIVTRFCAPTDEQPLIRNQSAKHS